MPILELDPKTTNIHGLLGKLAYPEEEDKAKAFAAYDCILNNMGILEMIRGIRSTLDDLQKIKEIKNYEEFHEKKFLADMFKFDGFMGLYKLLITNKLKSEIEGAKLRNYYAGKVLLVTIQMHNEGFKPVVAKACEIVADGVHTNMEDTPPEELTKLRGIFCVTDSTTPGTVTKSWQSNKYTSHWWAARYAVEYSDDNYDKGLTLPQQNYVAKDLLKRASEIFIGKGTNAKPLLKTEEAWSLADAFKTKPIKYKIPSLSQKAKDIIQE